MVTIERRARPRLSHGALPHGLTARIRPGYDVRVVNVSTRGALVETRCRLRPDAKVVVHVEAAGRATDVRAVVGRTYVSHLRPTDVLFRAALLFDTEVLWTGASADAAEAE